LSKNNKLTVAQIRLLEQAAAAANQIATLPTPAAPTKQQEPVIFKLSTEEGKSITGCTAGDERAFCEWLFNSLDRVLASGVDASAERLRLMEAALLAPG
jgi:hypothetical protein